VLVSLGLVANLAGDEVNAQSWLDEALRVARASGSLRGVSLALWGLGHLAGTRGEDQRAAVMFRESLSVAQATGRSELMLMNVEGLARAAMGNGRAARAALLLGAATALRQSRGILWPPVEQAGHEALVREATAALGEDAFAVAWAAGQALTLDEAVAEALTEEGDDG
jgi:hypothetical protein